MTDVLKLAEEALVNLHSFAQPHNRMTDEPWAWMEREYEEALTALRAARAEWGWLPIAEMAEHEEFSQATILGRWGWWYGTPPERWCLGNCGHMSRSEAIKSGYTHFCRPQLPPPPAREEKEEEA